jgi:hypothetical protein
MESVNSTTLLSQILSIELVIPAWQMAFFIITLSLFLLVRRIKVCLITTFLFTFYWGFFLYWGDIIASFGSYPNLATLYLVSGMVHIVLTLVAFFREG